MPNTPANIPDPNDSETNSLTILLQRAMGLDNAPKFTEKQMDEALAQRGKIIDYIHQDNVRASGDSRFYLVAILIFILIFSGGVLLWRPDLFSQVLSFLAGLFGGGLGGYGIANRSKN